MQFAGHGVMNKVGLILISHENYLFIGEPLSLELMLILYVLASTMYNYE